MLGDLDDVVRVVKVVGFVASAPYFTGQPGVVNGASELLGEVFGDAGVHARSAVGVAVLPPTPRSRSSSSSRSAEPWPARPTSRLPPPSRCERRPP